MANEITVQSSLTINNVAGGLPAVKHGGDVKRFDQTTKNKRAGKLACTTTAASIDLTALTAKGFCYFENIDTTNTVVVVANNGTADSDAFVFPPKTGYYVYLADGSTYKGKTTAGTASLIYEAYDA